MKTLKLSLLFLTCVGIASLLLTAQLCLIQELQDRSYVGPPLQTCSAQVVAEQASQGLGEVQHGSIVAAPDRAPAATCLSESAMLCLPLLATLLAVLAWAVGSSLAGWDSARMAALPLDPPPSGRDDAVSYLRQGTLGAGDFVILQHAVEDLRPPVSPDQLADAVERARRDAPQLEHREVAGRWILRRPRV